MSRVAQEIPDRDELALRARSADQAELGSKVVEPLGLTSAQARCLRKAGVSIQISALLIALNGMLWKCAGVRLKQLGFDLLVRLTERSSEINDIAATGAYWLLLVLLLAGGVSKFVNRQEADLAFVMGWALLSFQVKIGSFVWWPTPYGWVGAQFGITSTSGADVVWAFRIVIPPLLIALWAMAAVSGPQQEPVANVPESPE